MIELHASQFRAPMAMQAEKVYLSIKKYCTHINKKVRFAAVPALEEFFYEVAMAITDGSMSSERALEVFTVRLFDQTRL